MRQIIGFLVVLFFLISIFREGCGCVMDIFERVQSNQTSTAPNEVLPNSNPTAPISEDVSSSIATLSTYQKLFLFGGNNNNVYLGCLTCDKYDSESIWNAYGTYGSKYNSNSIWNKYGTYGSEYNSYSPWNKYSSSSPIILDENKKSYGYFTVNKYKGGRAEADWILKIYENYEAIMEDVGAWYDKIF